MKTQVTFTNTTDEKTGHNYVYATWTNRGTEYNFYVSTWGHNKGRVSGMSKRKNYYGFGTTMCLTEKQFIEKYAKQGAAEILSVMKSRLSQSGHRVTDTH